MKLSGAGNGGDWPDLQPAAVAVSPWPRSIPFPPTHVQPRSGPAPFLRDFTPSLTNRTQLRRTRVAAPKCACSCHSRMSFRRVTIVSSHKVGSGGVTPSITAFF